jgi:riboflavin biosynthesis pyrimidine reductase
LTVRHVAGKNPCPVIIGSSYEDLGYLLEARMDPLILIGSNDEVHDQRVKSLSLNRINGVIQSPDILKALYSEGISSVYIEGGSFTTSHFLEDGSIDVLQLHLSPLMLGSGINSFNLPVILNISSAIRFKYQIYIPVDNGMMFIGLPEFNSKEG